MTGLDRLGIPVCMAVRPNSRGLAVSQGKGLELIAAKVSAAAESIEAWHAERPLCQVLLERYDDLSERARVVDPSRLPLARNGSFVSNSRIPWTPAIEISSEESVWVPFELVHADATLPRMPGSGSFVFSTNGLASGNNAAEAVLHAACELIERDAIALWKQRSEQCQTATRIALESVDDPDCVSLLERFDKSGITPMLWDVTSDIGIPAIRVLIHDRWSAAENTPFPTAFGAGCHPDRGVALSRALTEAAQSRLTAIAGSRDDGPRHKYAATQDRETANFYSNLAALPGQRNFKSIATAAFDTIEADLLHVIGKMEIAGIDRVFIVDLTRPGSPLVVVRCIIPGLDGPSSSPSYLPGARAMAVSV